MIQQVNSEHQERRIDYEKFSKIKRRTRKEIDDAIQFSLKNPVLLNTAIVLKVLRRRFDKYSGAHFNREDIVALWPFEYIYEGLSKHSQQPEDHWINLLVELERALLLKKSSTEVEVENLLEMLTIGMPRQMFSSSDGSPSKDSSPLILRQRPADINRKEQLTVFFNHEYSTYFSMVEITTRFELPPVVGKYIRTASFFFNQKDYNLIGKKLTEELKCGVMDKDGYFSFTILIQVELLTNLPKGVLFVTCIDLELTM